MSMDESGLSPSTRLMIAGVRKFGGRAGEDLPGFLTQVEGIAVTCGVPPRSKGILLLSALEGAALRLCLSHLRSDFSWEVLQRIYSMPNEQLYLRQTAQALNQTSTVDIYTDQFLGLLNRFDACQEIDKAYYYISGLKDEVRVAVWRTNITTLDDAFRAASTIDRGTLASSGQLMESPPASTPMDLDSHEVRTVVRNEARRCFFCNKTGHLIRDCWARKNKARQKNAACRTRHLCP